MKNRKFPKSHSVKLLAVITASLLVMGCNTVKGAGQDIESVGQAGDDAINR